MLSSNRNDLNQVEIMKKQAELSESKWQENWPLQFLWCRRRVEGDEDASAHRESGTPPSPETEIWNRFFI